MYCLVISRKFFWKKIFHVTLVEFEKLPFCYTSADCVRENSTDHEASGCLAGESVQDPTNRPSSAPVAACFGKKNEK